MLSKSFLLPLLLASPTIAQINLLNISSTQAGLSANCIGVLNQAVNCNETLTTAGSRGKFEGDELLQGLCTTACSRGLTIWQSRVVGACGTNSFIQHGEGNSVSVLYWPEIYLERYNQLCLANNNKFCHAVIRDLAGINPDDQSQTATPASTMMCDDCYLKLMQTQLAMPFFSNAPLASTFTSLTSSCAKTGFAVTTPTATTVFFSGSTGATGTVSPTPTASCSGKLVTVSSADTCNSVAKANNIDTYALLGANNLAAYCANFPKSGTVCVPSASTCKVYEVKSGDTCTTIADANGLSWAQVVSWNPAVQRDCSALSSLVGYIVCVSNPGGSWVNPSPEPTSTSITTQGPSVVYTPMPTPTYPGIRDDTGFIPYANGTREDCYLYVTTDDLYTTDHSASSIASGYAVNISDFLGWNPSLTGSGAILQEGFQYCAQRINVTAQNITDYCVQYQVAPAGMNCTIFTWMNGVQLEVFKDLNPTVGSKCENWKTGLEYCVAARGYRPAGFIPTCSFFVQVNDTAWHDSTPCQKLEDRFGLSHARFIAWNPTIDANCTGLEQYYAYCVSTLGYRPTYSTSVSLAAATPTP